MDTTIISKVDDVIDVFKSDLVDLEEKIKSVDIPMEHEFESHEAYIDFVNTYLEWLFTQISDVKKYTFSSVLNIYNQSLDAEKVLKKELEDDSNRVEFMEKRFKHEVKKSLIMAGVLSFLSPSLFPILVLLNAVPLLLSRSLVKSIKSSYKRSQENYDEFKKLQNELYDFQDMLRTNYHDSKSKLCKLKQIMEKNPEAFINDSDVMETLISMVSLNDYPLPQKTEENGLIVVEQPKRLSLN